MHMHTPPRCICIDTSAISAFSVSPELAPWPCSSCLALTPLAHPWLGPGSAGAAAALQPPLPRGLHRPVARALEPLPLLQRLLRVRRCGGRGLTDRACARAISRPHPGSPLISRPHRGRGVLSVVSVRSFAGLLFYVFCCSLCSNFLLSVRTFSKNVRHLVLAGVLSMCISDLRACLRIAALLTDPQTQMYQAQAQAQTRREGSTMRRTSSTEQVLELIYSKSRGFAQPK